MGQGKLPPVSGTVKHTHTHKHTFLCLLRAVGGNSLKSAISFCNTKSLVVCIMPGNRRCTIKVSQTQQLIKRNSANDKNSLKIT